MKGRWSWDRWLLERCAPDDVEEALRDLSRVESGYVGQLVSICAYGLRDRARRRLARGVSAMGLNVRLALRSLRRTPGTCVTAVLALAISLTATVVILGNFYGTFRALPVPDGERVVQIRVLDSETGSRRPTTEWLRAWETSPALEAVGLVRSEISTVSVVGQTSLRLPTATMTPDAMSIAGVLPALGRLPSGSENREPVAFVAYDVFEGHFGADPSVVGSDVRVAGRNMTLLGVMPASFGYPLREKAWVVGASGRLDLPPGGTEVIARLREGVTESRASDVLGDAFVAAGLVDGDPSSVRVRVLPWIAERGSGGEAIAFGVLVVLVTLLLIVSAVNVSALLLLRAEEGSRALALHSALGAPRTDLAVRPLIEAAVLVLLGSGLGLWWGTMALAWIERELSPHWGYYWMEMTVDGRVLATLVALLAVASLVGGATPALSALRDDFRGILGGGRGDESIRASRRGRLFVSVQVMLSTVGLVAALLLTRSVLAVGIDRGLARLPLEETLLVQLSHPDHEQAPYPMAELMGRAEEAVSTLPGVVAVTTSRGLHAFGNRRSRVEVQGSGPPDSGDDPGTTWNAVGSNFQGAFQVPLLRGREISRSDGPEDPVAVVNRSFAEGRLGGVSEALGRWVRIDGVHESESFARVVGVVEDFAEVEDGMNVARVFVPLADVELSSAYLVIRFAGDASELTPLIRSALSNLEAGFAPDSVITYKEFVAYLRRMPRVMAAFGAIGGFVGVLVAGLGMYGLVGHRVRTQQRAFGIRRALGSSPRSAVVAVVLDAFKLVAPGLAAGLILSLVLAPSLAFLVLGAAPLRLDVAVASVGLLAGTVVISALPAASRAALADPLAVLKGE